MAEKQPSENIYNQIVKAYSECPSVRAISLVLGASKMTVQRVLITEGLWESKRSRGIVELAKQGKTAEQIATKLYLSLKCVQNYMPYKRGMRQECVTANAKIAKQKRELFEENGIKGADIYPVCDYWGFNSQACSNGMVFLAVVHSLGELPESEMKETKMFDTLPDELTYPQTLPKLYAEAAKILHTRQMIYQRNKEGTTYGT